MNQKQIEAARFLNTVWKSCRISTQAGTPLTGAEYDAITEAIDCLEAFARISVPQKTEEDTSKP